MSICGFYLYRFLAPTPFPNGLVGFGDGRFLFIFQAVKVTVTVTIGERDGIGILHQKERAPVLSSRSSLPSVDHIRLTRSAPRRVCPIVDFFFFSSVLFPDLPQVTTHVRMPCRQCFSPRPAFPTPFRFSEFGAVTIRAAASFTVFLPSARGSRCFPFRLSQYTRGSAFAQCSRT